MGPVKKYVTRVQMTQCDPFLNLLGIWLIPTIFRFGYMRGCGEAFYWFVIVLIFIFRLKFIIAVLIFNSEVSLFFKNRLQKSVFFLQVNSLVQLLSVYEGTTNCHITSRSHGPIVHLTAIKQQEYKEGHRDKKKYFPIKEEKQAEAWSLISNVHLFTIV